MRARTLVFALICGTATAALAQDGGYVRFPSTSPDACALACASDRMCASWSYGAIARSYGQSQSTSGGAAMCTFSGSTTIRSSPGIVSGLPRRNMPTSQAPTMSAPPNQGGRSLLAPPNQAQQTGQSQHIGSRRNERPSGWEVRPAPWLNQNTPPQPNPSNWGTMPPNQPSRDAPPVPAGSANIAPRIEYEQQTRGPIAQPLPQPQYQAAPAYVPPVYAPPVYAPPMSPPPISAPPISAPPISAPVAPVIVAPPRAPQSQQRRLEQPPFPPGTQAVPDGRFIETPNSRVPTPRGAQPSVPVPQQAPDEPVGGAPPRQDVTVRPSVARGTPRPPVRDPSNPESFRGADGMIDAAEMRRAQLNAAREQGTPAYSVQREWEAIESERQRAEAAGEVRVDPLAGSVPVPPPPETRAERRLREAEERAEKAAQELEDARANGRSSDSAEEAPPATRNTNTRKARGVPRPRAPRATRAGRPAPAQALDREPRLAGGPGS